MQTTSAPHSRSPTVGFLLPAKSNSFPDKSPLLARISDDEELEFPPSDDDRLLPEPRGSTSSMIPSINELTDFVSVNHKKFARDALVQPDLARINEITFAPVPSMTSDEFTAVFESVKRAISRHIYPTRISQGSSGSYFCKNEKGEIVGVFKPKNEEPYGHLNPKWTKWIHKNLFPCCFGRSCLIPNLGYVSEAAASYMDRALGLSVCPRTEVVSLSSPSFYYSVADCNAFYRQNIPLPEKIGSFQIFLRNFKDATTFFKEGYQRIGLPSSTSRSGLNAASLLTGNSGITPSTFLYSSVEQWSEQTQKEFQWGFERLVILDYLIRNTDRGSDNWMIQYNPKPSSESETTKTATDASAPVQEPRFSLGGDDEDKPILDGLNETLDNITIDISSPSFSKTAAADGNEPTKPQKPQEPTIKVAAIDNGLAFPWKHPDQWRSYPYGWAFLPCARVPFSKETREYVLHLLTSQEWWNETLAGLERLFRIDPDFNEKMWKKQKAVIRGQGYNLVEVLRRSQLGDTLRGSPWALVQRPAVAVYDDEDESSSNLRRRLRNAKQRFEHFINSQPCFTWW